MPQHNLTIKDIAEALHLSHSTVSRALKDSYKISDETKKIVREYAEQHHYRPNLLAQGLKNKKSRCIGVVLCNIPNSFFSEAISGIESVAYKKDYMVMITQSHESLEREIKNIENLAWRSVDGLLVSLSSKTQDASHFTALAEQDIPIVFFDRVPDDINTYSVISDNEGGAYAGTEYLINTGHKKIAHITSAAHLSISKERLSGYAAALQKHGIEYNESYVQYCEHGGMYAEEVEKSIMHFLALPKPPDAIFTASDRITISCLSILNKKNIAIPKQIAVVGFSNFSSPELFYPPLTTVKQSAFEMGKASAELLLQLIEEKKKPKFKKIILPTELNIRESS
ncbi:LacI family DNA-binding transcriptional regulator [Chitinophagaceae bacterium LWZ2-11]